MQRSYILARPCVGGPRGRIRDPLTAVCRLLLWFAPAGSKPDFSSSPCYEHDGEPVTCFHPAPNRGRRTHASVGRESKKCLLTLKSVVPRNAPPFSMKCA